MAANHANTSSNPPSKLDPTAPAGSENSLGAESVREGRPATDDRTVEAMDEESPDITGTLDTPDTKKGSTKDTGRPPTRH